MLHRTLYTYLLYNIIVSVWERACDLILLYLVVAWRLCCIYFHSSFSSSVSTFDFVDEEKMFTDMHTRTHTYVRVRAVYLCECFCCCCIDLLFVEAKSILLLLIHFIYSEHWKMCSPLIVVSFGVLAIHVYARVCVCVYAWLRWALVIRAYSYFYSVLTVYLFIFTFFFSFRSVVSLCFFFLILFFFFHMKFITFLRDTQNLNSKHQ